MNAEPEQKTARSQVPAPEPYAVPMPETQRLLGDKSRSAVYELIGLGKLVAKKDGMKLLVTLESIRRYSESLPPAKIKPPRPRRPHSDRRRRRK